MMRLILCLLAFLVVSLPTQAQSITCPSTMSSKGTNLALTDSRIFVGPPGENNEVMPEDGEWEVASFQNDGKKVFLVCRYGSTSQKFELPIGQNYCTTDDNNILCR